MYTTLEVLYDGPIATLWLNRPEVHNAFNANADRRADCRLPLVGCG
jgi:methylglutaconyl-CoA hydratase